MDYSLPSQYAFAAMQQNAFVENTTTETRALQPPPPQYLWRNDSIVEQLREIFPSRTISTSAEMKFLSREDFKNHAAQALPFIQFKYGNILSQYLVAVTSTTTNEDDEIHHHEQQQQRERLYRLLKSSKNLNDRTGEENVSWSKVDDVLKKLPIPLRKKKKYSKCKKITIATTTTTRSDNNGTNVEISPSDISTAANTKQREAHADTRMGYRFGNMFAVKRYFTFGERMTQPGEIHLIQTADVPLLYNEVKPEYRIQLKREWDTRPNFRNGRFDPSDQKYFRTFVLNPHSFYVVPENSIYLLVTAQKTLFSIDRFEEEAFRRMIAEDWRWKNIALYRPNEHKELLLIQIPIPTTTTTRSGATGKRKRVEGSFSLDNETNWIYNDELNPPKIFNYQNGGGIGGSGHQEDIQFTPYYYFQEQQQQQQRDLYAYGGNNMDIVDNDPPPLQNVVVDSPNPGIIPISPPPLQNGAVGSPPPPTMLPIDKDSFETPSFYFDWDSFEDKYLPVPTPQQNKEFDDLLVELGNMAEIDETNNPNRPTVDTTNTSNLFDNSCDASAATLTPLPLVEEEENVIADTPDETLNKLNAIMEEMNNYGKAFC